MLALGTTVDHLGVDIIFNEPTVTGRIRSFPVVYLDPLHISGDSGWTAASTGILHGSCSVQDPSSPDSW